jgi:hypothetical protein
VRDVIPMHNNIFATDDGWLSIEFDEDCRIRIDTDLICEFVEKACVNKKHPRVQDMIERLLPLLVRAAR